jgi:Tfp pilus assembly protein PilN
MLAVIGAHLIALVTGVAGVWMMRYGFKLTEQQTNLLGLKETVQTSLTAVKDTVVMASNTMQEGLPTTTPPPVATAPNASPTINNPTTMPTAAQTQAATQQMQAATQQVQAATQTFSGTADYVRGLAELAKNLTDLTPAVSAFVVSTILFFIAGGIETAIIFAVF